MLESIRYTPLSNEDWIYILALEIVRMRAPLL